MQQAKKTNSLEELVRKINHKILMPIVFCIVIVSVYFLNKEKPEDLELKKLTFNERVEEMIY